LLTFAGLPYTEEPGDLVGCDVAVVGAPMDELATDRPGTRMGPRAIRAESDATTGGHLEAGADWSEALRVVDYGDAPVIPADPAASHREIESIVSEVRRAGAIPLILGGDHSITEPCVRGCAAGPLGLVHFDAHTDTASELWDVEVSHGTPMRRLVEQGHVDGRRYAQIGLRGYWPGEPEFAWQESKGITSFFMHDVRRLGIDTVVERTTQAVGDDPVYLTVDIDALDPAFAPGTGTPEPGGMSVHELLSACRRIAAATQLVGADVVEVLPDRGHPVDITALAAARIVGEILTGLALRGRRRSGGG
jgi:agmatinase